MRIRVTNRLALTAAVAVVAVGVATARLPSAQAAGTALTNGDFHEVALQGFGDPVNSWAWSMAVFNNHLLVGTNRDYYCFEWAAFHKDFLFPYPPALLQGQTVLCPPDPQAMPLAGEIWSLPLNHDYTTPITQSNWQRVYQSPYNVTVNITSTSAITLAPRDMGFRGMSVYTEPDGTQALYVGGANTKPMNGSNVPPPSLLRSTDGQTFKAVPSDPGTTMGNINTLPNIPSYLGIGKSGACCIRGQVTYKGYLVTTFGGFQGAGAAFASANPAQGDNSFVQISPPGMSVFEIEPFNGHLYLGIDSTSGGYSVVRTDCVVPESPTQVGCNASDFTTIVPAGGGLGAAGNGGITSMHVYTDTAGIAHLYVGTDGANNATPAEIVRINADPAGGPDTWDLVVGNSRMVNNELKTPLSGLTSGFGWWFNQHMWRMNDYQGVLYVGTFDASEFWQGTSIASGLGPWMGFDLWASADGVNFTPITQNGFGDQYSFGARGIQGTPNDGLFVGSTDWNQGLRIWQGTPSQSSIQLQPHNVQTDASGTPGTVALAWDAPSNATQFHIFRSLVASRTLPRPKQASLRLLMNLVHLPKSVAVPASYSEIGTTTTPYFVDHDVLKGAHYSYYVVSADASGNLSQKSNVVSIPSAMPAPSFHYAAAVVKFYLKHHRLDSTQAASINKSLGTAFARLYAGDAQGSHDALESLRQQLVGSMHGTAHGRSGLENMWLLLGRLEKRLTLVNAHVVPASHVY